ncbi:MAG: PspA/IM30 family protein, partial [Pseudomonadota bacterium]
LFQSGKTADITCINFANAPNAIIIEQKIRDAETGHGAAKRGLAALVARIKTEKKALDAVEVRIRDLDERTRLAVEAGKEQLAFDAAKLLAELENERTVRRRALATAEEKADRMRLALERTQRQLVDLQQGLITARSIETERAAYRNMQGDLSAHGALRDGEAVLKRLLESADPAAEIDALEEVEADLSGDAVVDRLAEAGFGPGQKVRPEDVLARFQNKTPSEPA